ncbi:MAG TPA: hypothetical protein VGP82_19215 [Ktedonobacterales bacterium]|nr:hypothetical protein [Ktedonobacterales bacterium]
MSPCLLGALDMQVRARAELHRFEDALAVAQAASACTPTSTLAWRTKGVLLLLPGCPDEASEVFDRALELRPYAVTAEHGKAQAQAQAQAQATGQRD